MSSVIIDSTPILYPKVMEPDIFVIMSEEGFLKYGRDAIENSMMIIDSSLVHSRPATPHVLIPATTEARRILKRDIVANIVMLGALVQITGVVSPEALEKAILDSVPKGTEELNIRAMKLGFTLAGEKQ